MEPNTTSAAAGMTPAVADHGPSSAHAERLLSPPSFFPQPPPGLLPASGPHFGSPAAAVNGSLAVQGHAAPPPLPSTFFPDAGTLHMTGGDVFAQQEAPQPEVTAFPTPLGSQQPWQGQPQPSPWTTASGFPAYPGADGFSGFAEDQSEAALEQMAVTLEQMAAAARQSETSLLSPPSGSGDDNRVVWPQPPPSDCELAPLPACLRISSLEKASAYTMPSPIGVGSMMMPWINDCGASGMDDVGGSISSVPNLPIGGGMAEAAVDFQGAGGSSNFTGFAQPSSDSELVQLPASLQAPQLPIAGDDGTRRDPGQDGSSHMGIKSSSRPKLSGRAKKKSRLLHGNATEVIFTDSDKETIGREKKLQELMVTDPKKVKRILLDRMCAAKRKLTQDMHILELENQVGTLQGKWNTLFSELQLLQEQSAALRTQNNEMSIMIQEMERHALLKEAVSETLQSQIQALNIRLNTVQMIPEKIDETNVWGANYLHQQNSTQITDGSGSHIDDLQQQMIPHMVQPEQLQIQEPSVGHRQVHPQQPQHKHDQFMGEQ